MPLTFRDTEDALFSLLPVLGDPDLQRAVDQWIDQAVDTTRALAEILEIDVVGTASVPHGYAVGSDRGQVEVFSASGAVRARNTERLHAGR